MYTLNSSMLTFPYTVCQFYWIRNWMFYLPAIKPGSAWFYWSCHSLTFIFAYEIVSHFMLSCGRMMLCTHNAISMLCYCVCLPLKCVGSAHRRQDDKRIIDQRWNQQNHHQNQSVILDFSTLRASYVHEYFGFYNRLNLQRLIREMLFLIYVRIMHWTRHRSMCAHTVHIYAAYALGFNDQRTGCEYCMKERTSMSQWRKCSVSDCTYILRAESNIVCYTAELYSCMF